VKTCEGIGCGRLNTVFVSGTCKEPPDTPHWIEYQKPSSSDKSVPLGFLVSRPSHLMFLFAMLASQRPPASLPQAAHWQGAPPSARLTSYISCYNYPAGKKGTCFRTSSGAHIYTTPNIRVPHASGQDSVPLSNLYLIPHKRVSNVRLRSGDV